MIARRRLYGLWRALGAALPLAVLLALARVAPVLGGAEVAETLITDTDAAADAAEDAREAAIRAELEGQTDGEGRTVVSLSPTAWAFVNDRRATVVILEGPRREGKSVSAVVRLLRVAAEYPRAWPIKVACVRDSWTNLSRTVSATLRQGHARGWWTAEFREQDTECILNAGAAHIYLFGMDRPADANKFQSFECGVLWIEEPAPAADLASGIPVEVFAIGISSLSQPGLPCHCIITMNPADSMHWTSDILSRLSQLGRAELTVARYWIPPGENRHVPAGYRQRMRAALEAAGRFDLVERLVEGRTGTITLGVAVTPDYIEAQHVAPEPLLLSPAWPAYMSLDFGLTPAAVLAQTSPRGHLYVIGALETPEGAAMGIDQFMSQIVGPWMARFGIRMRPTAPAQRGSARAAPHFRFRLFGDPSGASREASNSERSAAATLEQMLGISFEPGPPDWPARRDSMAWALRQPIGARRLVQLDPDETGPLQRALKGGWHYHRSSSGVVSDRPLKSHPSHVGDAFGMLCAQLYPVADTLRKLARGTEGAPSRPPRPRAKSWYGR